VATVRIILRSLPGEIAGRPLKHWFPGVSISYTPIELGYGQQGQKITLIQNNGIDPEDLLNSLSSLLKSWKAEIEIDKKEKKSKKN